MIVAYRSQNKCLLDTACRPLHLNKETCHKKGKTPELGYFKVSLLASCQFLAKVFVLRLNAFMANSYPDSNIGSEIRSVRVLEDDFT